jgi:tetratricopeptide (TPR) repeat protein
MVGRYWNILALLIVVILLFSGPGLFYQFLANIAMLEMSKGIHNPDSTMLNASLDGSLPDYVNRYLSRSYQRGINQASVGYHLALMELWSENPTRSIEVLERTYNTRLVPYADFLYGYLLWTSGEVENSRSVLAQIPETKRFFENMVFATESSQDYELMEFGYWELSSLDPESVTAQGGYWYSKSLNLLNRIDPEEGELETALAHTLEFNSDEDSRLLNLGRMLVLTKRYVLAEPILERAVDVNDARSHWANYYLGLAYYYQGKYDLAEKLFLQTVEINPDFGRGYHWLARTLVKAGRAEEAKIPYEKALENLPEDESLLLEYQRYKGSHPD